VNEHLPQALARRLEERPCRPVAGTRFEPDSRLGRRYDRFPDNARQAAVLVLLYPHRQRWHVPLTVRPTSLPDHGGQVSLPGGAIEPGESSAAAAIREFREELGGDRAEIRMLGRRAPIYVEVSNFRVQPWVGSATERPRLVPNPAEVDEVLEVPLAHLIDPVNFGCHQRHDEPEAYTAPHFAWHSHQIWGATCMILGQFVVLLEELGVCDRL